VAEIEKIDPEVEEEWLTWTKDVHVPAMLGCPGYISCTRYVNDEGDYRRYLHIYELSGPEAVQTPEYLANRGSGPFEGHVHVDRIRNFQLIEE
jgi:antibiotic biosynthesis monooxygenase (ABM) superfamily enzyme